MKRTLPKVITDVLHTGEVDERNVDSFRAAWAEFGGFSLDYGDGVVFGMPQKSMRLFDMAAAVGKSGAI